MTFRQPYWQRNPGERFPVLGRPANSCSFSGCGRTYDRHAQGRWPACKPHADAIEGKR